MTNEYDMENNKPTPANFDAGMPVIAYLRATASGEPIWTDDCVCQDAVFPSDPDGSDENDVSMPMVRQSDAQAALAAKDAEIAAMTAERDALSLLSKYEQQAVMKDLAGLVCLINYHDAKSTEAEASDYAECCPYHDNRVLALLAIGRAIIAEDPEIWLDREKDAFALRWSEKQDIDAAIAQEKAK